MIGYRMPLFQEGSLLTKEMLEDLKFFSVVSADLSFANYADGIISGGEITGDKDFLYIEKCMLKHGDYVLLIPERTKVNLQKTQNMQVVVFEIKDIEITQNFEQVQILPRTESNRDVIEKGIENGIEICRVQMQDGARLRSEYTDFFDMNTRYDTLNLIHSQWSAYKEPSMHPRVLEQFYREAVFCHGKEMVDHAFLLQIGNLQGRTCERKCIEYYLDEKVGHSSKKRSNEEIYKDLCKALRELKKAKKQVVEKKVERRMIVD